MIGQALLERYEALSRKCEVGVEELEEQVRFQKLSNLVLRNTDLFHLIPLLRTS